MLDKPFIQFRLIIYAKVDLLLMHNYLKELQAFMNICIRCVIPYNVLVLYYVIAYGIICYREIV